MRDLSSFWSSTPVMSARNSIPSISGMRWYETMTSYLRLRALSRACFVEWTTSTRTSPRRSRNTRVLSMVSELSCTRRT